LILGVSVGFLLYEFPDFQPLVKLTTSSVATLLAITGIPALSSGSFLMLPGRGSTILSWECSGILLLLAFLGGVALLPKVSLKARLLGLSFLPLVYAGNIFRVYLAAIAGYLYGVGAMMTFHLSAGLIFYLAWFYAAWVAWLRLARRL